MTRLVPATDTSPADWIVAALTTFGASVVSLVPDGFPSYVRVFHPAYTTGPDRRGERGKPISWFEIAAAHGTQVHAGMQLSGLTGIHSYRESGDPGVYDWVPSVGSLLRETASPLASVLARHTATPSRCWFALWSGFGATRKELRSAPKFEVPNRDYFLLRGPVDAIIESTNQPNSWHQSANIWWPDDHAWCVATEIDLDTTYIACGEACRDEILATPNLEAFEIEPAAGIGWASDRVNPKPLSDAPS